MSEGALQPASPTIRAGTPATVLQGGTSVSTTDPAATLAARRNIARADACTSEDAMTTAPRARMRTPCAVTLDVATIAADAVMAPVLM